jgi:hypothetical protein
LCGADAGRAADAGAAAAIGTATTAARIIARPTDMRAHCLRIFTANLPKKLATMRRN